MSVITKWLGIAPCVLNEFPSWSQESCVIAGYCPSQLDGDLTSAWNISTLGRVATGQRGCHLSANSLISAKGLRGKSENQGFGQSQMAWTNMARSGTKIQVNEIQESYFVGTIQWKVCVQRGKFLTICPACF